jgi:hypothetical protein
MATISVDNWLDELIPAAQLCPNPIIRKDIVNACREFCRRTELWTQDLPAISIVADQSEYPLTTTGADIVGGNRATIVGNADPLSPVSEEALDEDEREAEFWRTKTAGSLSEVTRYFVTSNYDIRLVYIPGEALADGLNVNVAVMPLEGATSVPLFLYNEFKEVIANGAKARLKLRVDMPWTDLNLGAGLYDLFEQGIFAGRQKKFTGFQKVKTRDIVRTHYHDF